MSFFILIIALPSFVLADAPLPKQPPIADVRVLLEEFEQQKTKLTEYTCSRNWIQHHFVAQTTFKGTTVPPPEITPLSCVECTASSTAPTICSSQYKPPKWWFACRSDEQQVLDFTLRGETLPITHSWMEVWCSENEFYRPVSKQKSVGCMQKTLSLFIPLLLGVVLLYRKYVVSSEESENTPSRRAG